MPERIVHQNGLLRTLSIKYDATDPADVEMMVEHLKAISVRKDLGQTLRDKLRQELADLRAAAVHVVGKAGLPTEDGHYVQEGEKLRKLRRSELTRLGTKPPKPGTKRSYVRFPFFKVEKLSSADLAAQLINEIDLLQNAADSSVTCWEMVDRALRFSSAYHAFIFELTGANKLADIERRRRESQRESLSERLNVRRVNARKWQDRAVDAARVMKGKNPRLSMSAIAQKLASQFCLSPGHIGRVLRARRAEFEGKELET